MLHTYVNKFTAAQKIPKYVRRNILLSTLYSRLKKKIISFRFVFLFFFSGGERALSEIRHVPTESGGRVPRKHFIYYLELQLITIYLVPGIS